MVEPDIKKIYIDTGKATLVWHNFAWLGDESRLAAQGGRCAGQQGKFWEYHDYLYHHQRGENQGQFSASNLKGFAAELGLDKVAFNTCLDAGHDLPALADELRVGRAKGITATPYFVINGQPRAGALTLAQMSAVLDAELKKQGG